MMLNLMDQRVLEMNERIGMFKDPAMQDQNRNSVDRLDHGAVQNPL